jgi:hypothetical protein
MISHGKADAVRRAIAALVVGLAVVALSPVTAGANPIAVWFFDDAPPPGWGSELPDWEHAGFFMPLGSSYQDLYFDHPLYACTGPFTLNKPVIWVIQSRIWFSSVLPISSQLLVQLRKGTWGDEGVVVAEDLLTVSSATPTEYVSDLVSAAPLVINDESWIIKITLVDPPIPGLALVRIYWADPNYESHMWQVLPLGVETSTWGKVKALYRQ